MQLRVRRRWVHPLVSIVAGILVAIFAPIIWVTLKDPATFGEGIRIIIPPFFLFLYLAVALALNFRIATVRPDSVKVSVPPIPMLRSITVDRNDIRHAYARTVVNHDEENKETERYFSAGVETRQGRQVDVTGPQPTLKMALERAEDIARILNAGQHRHAIPAIEAAASPDDSNHKTLVLIWMAAFIGLVLIGAAWEISATATNLHYSGPRFW